MGNEKTGKRPSRFGDQRVDDEVTFKTTTKNKNLPQESKAMKSPAKETKGM